MKNIASSYISKHNKHAIDPLHYYEYEDIQSTLSHRSFVQDSI